MARSKERALEILKKKEEFKLESIELWLRAKIVLQFILLREQQNLTQAKVAERMHIKRQQISKFENMENSPTLAFLVRYADLLGTELDVVLKGISLVELGIK